MPLLSTQTGTPYYASPEVWQDQPYDQKSDIWSLGCIFYEMLMLQPAFKSTSMNELYKKVVNAKFSPMSKDIPPDLKNLIKLILQPIPRQRPSCEGILNQEVIQRFLEESGLSVDQCLSDNEHAQVSLLNTIRLTHKLSSLNK